MYDLGYHLGNYLIQHSFMYHPEKAMAPYSSTLAWRIPWTEEPGRLQPMGSRRRGHDWATSLSLFAFMLWRRKWQPTPVFLPGEIPGTGESGGLPSMGLHRIGHNWSDLAAAAAYTIMEPTIHWFYPERNRSLFKLQSLLAEFEFSSWVSLSGQLCSTLYNL